MATLLILGGTGRTGAHLLRLALAEGIEQRLYVLGYSQNNNAVFGDSDFF